MIYNHEWSSMSSTQVWVELILLMHLEWSPTNLIQSVPGFELLSGIAIYVLLGLGEVTDHEVG